MTDLAVHFEGVGKDYPFFTLDDIHLELPTGAVMGFIGANGAGKSTTIRILMGLVHQARGTVQVLGHPMPAQQALPSGMWVSCPKTCGSTDRRRSRGTWHSSGGSTRAGTKPTPRAWRGASI